MRAVTEAISSSGVMTVMMTWLGTRTPPTPINARTTGANAVRMSFPSIRTRHAQPSLLLVGTESTKKHSEMTCRL